MTKTERSGAEPVPKNSKRYRLDNLTKPGPGSKFDIEFQGRTYNPGKRWWGTPPEAMAGLPAQHRLQGSGNTLCYVRFWADFPYQPLNNVWQDTGTGGFLEEKLYVVQTRSTIVERCLLMTSDPGDLVLDPTCGSGTTAYVAEQWGRRWITCDVSRVPLALARQRLLTATFPWYELTDEGRGPIGGFVYKRKQNRKGEEVGGIIPHVTLKAIANNGPSAEEVLVDRPEVKPGVTRVSGPFAFEATMPTPSDWEAPGKPETAAAELTEAGTTDRLLEALRRSPTLHVGGKKTVTLKNVRRPARTLTLSAEAVVVNGEERPVAFVFGPENGPVVERLVYEAAREANVRSYKHLYVVGFAIDPKAREFIDTCDQAVGVPATYVQATPDLLMGDLLKNLRSSQIFSVCGLPEIKVHKVNGQRPAKFQVELLGLDVFDPITMEADQRQGNDVPAWFLDTDYNGLSFHVCQAFFPRTGAWDNLKKALKATHDDAVWEHLAGTKSAPFEAGEQKQVAVKVIDDRGNELMVVKRLA